MNSTTSISSPRTSSTPATSSQVVCDLAPWLTVAGLIRGIMPTVFHSSQAVRTRMPKKASGSHVVAKSATAWNQCPTISVRYRQRGCHALTEGRGRLPGRREADAAFTPGGDARRRAGLVDAARRVRDERDPAPAAEERLDGRVVAEVGRDSEEDDLVGIEQVEHRLGVGVRERVVV